MIIFDDRAATPNVQAIESHITKLSTPIAIRKGKSQLEGDYDSNSTIIYTPPVSDSKGTKVEGYYDSDTTNLDTPTASCSGMGHENMVPSMSSPTVNYKMTVSE